MTGQQRGCDIKVDINGMPYAVNRVFVGSSVAPIDTSNTEGKTGNPTAADAPDYAATLPDLKRGQMRFTSATFDARDNPFAAPLELDAGEYADIQVYPMGRDGPAHDYGNVLILDMSHEGSVPGPQPVTITVQTDGFYKVARA